MLVIPPVRSVNKVYIFKVSVHLKRHVVSIVCNLLFLLMLQLRLVSVVVRIQ